MSLPRTRETDGSSDGLSAFGLKLSRIRRRLGMSQGALAKATGMCQAHISAMERGISLPGRRALDKIKALPELDLEDGHRLTDAARRDREAQKKCASHRI